jgi:hypothetical protein
MDDNLIWSVIALFVLDLIVAIIIRKLGLEQVFAVMSVIAFLLPMSYFLFDWSTGIMDHKYTLNDLPNEIRTVLAYGLGSAFSGGVIGYLIGKLNSDPFS